MGPLKSFDQFKKPPVQLRLSVRRFFHGQPVIDPLGETVCVAFQFLEGLRLCKKISTELLQHHHGCFRKAPPIHHVITNSQSNTRLQTVDEAIGVLEKNCSSVVSVLGISLADRILLP